MKQNFMEGSRQTGHWGIISDIGKDSIMYIVCCTFRYVLTLRRNLLCHRDQGSWSQQIFLNPRILSEKNYIVLQPLKDKAQTALFKAPVRTAL